MKQRICLIEDDAIMGEALSERLDLEGYACDWFQSAEAAMRGLGKKRYAVAVSDIRLPDMSGETLFQRLRESGLELPPFLFITAHGAIDQAVRLLKLGAEDYLSKPLDIRALLGKVRELAERAEHARPSAREAGELGISAVMRRIEATLPRLAQHADTVLITGESGVGKEWVAQALHRQFDPEGRKPFVAVNCGAIPETLLESELFGHVKGAFTGAIRDKPGVFEQADGGTLFLDEIGDMPLTMQVKLLRVIQDRQVVKLGGEKSIPVSIKLICATHQDLKEMVRKGEFREDLYYRVHVMHLHVPPLRERKEDILWLAARFMAELCGSKGLPPRQPDPMEERTLTDYPWPGNIRELKHSLERACILGAQALVSAESLSEYPGLDPASTAEATSPERLTDFLAKSERGYITYMLEQHAWRITETAGHLGITRKALWDKMRRLGVARVDAAKLDAAAPSGTHPDVTLK
ncbi:MAG: sigma-54 dependent transcriptional regulator [Gallionellaceae bacterium]|nr:sigma-54 dependent transcriptional regulator [Gallionellaceae bacterium]